jgi:hypothetical protein
VDVRILATANIDVHLALATRKLREDLYYWLNAFTLSDSSLARSQRKSAAAAEALHLARVTERYGRPPLPYSSALMDACLKYNWPGNVRELENGSKSERRSGRRGYRPDSGTDELEPQGGCAHSEHQLQGPCYTRRGSTASSTRSAIVALCHLRLSHTAKMPHLGV